MLTAILPIIGNKGKQVSRNLGNNSLTKIDPRPDQQRFCFVGHFMVAVFGAAGLPPRVWHRPARFAPRTAVMVNG